VTKAVRDNSVVLGNPGRVIKTGVAGYQDVSV